VADSGQASPPIAVIAGTTSARATFLVWVPNTEYVPGHIFRADQNEHTAEELQGGLLQETEQTPDSESEQARAPADADPLLEAAIEFVAQIGTASTSMLQRRLRLAYTRAGRLIDMLERRGVISGYEGSKPRQVLIVEADVPRVVSELHQSGVRAER